MRKKILAILSIFLLTNSPIAMEKAFADDGHAAIKAGGITFEPTDAISMEKEYLEISPSLVRVRFVFKNLTNTPYKTIVAFPLPPLTCGWWAENSTVSNFKVSVNNKPIKPEVEQKAIENPDGGEKPVPFGTGKDITAKVIKAGLPTVCYKTFSDKKLFKKAQEAGLAQDFQGETEGVLYQTETIYHWEQVFPANTVTVIEHEYIPKTGFRASFRPYDEKEMKFRLKVSEDESTRLKVSKEGGFCYLIDYVLQTAKTWKGPIGLFELSVPVNTSDYAIWSNLGPLKLDADKKHAIFTKENFVPEGDLVIGIWNASADYDKYLYPNYLP